MKKVARGGSGQTCSTYFTRATLRVVGFLQLTWCSFRLRCPSDCLARLRTKDPGEEERSEEERVVQGRLNELGVYVFKEAFPYALDIGVKGKLRIMNFALSVPPLPRAHEPPISPRARRSWREEGDSAESMQEYDPYDSGGLLSSCEATAILCLAEEAHGRNSAAAVARTSGERPFGTTGKALEQARHELLVRLQRRGQS